jgi:hypothetical protein
MRKVLTAGTVWLLLLSSQATTVSASDRGADGRKLPVAKAARVESYAPLPASLRAKTLRPLNKNLFSDETILTENFDAGAPGWKFQDLWNEAYWHTSTTGALTGNSYWCADEALGGYDDELIQSLTSPAIALAAGTSTLTFMHSLSVESIAGPFPVGYDAWDAATVRISTNGTTFNVITPSAGPAYNATSAYGFHFYYGTGVAAWGGATGGYVSSSFNLTPYAGQTVYIRFELASDEAFSHGDDPTLFGWRIDDIEVTSGGNVVFSDDAGDTGDASFTAGGPGGQDQWHIKCRGLFRAQQRRPLCSGHRELPAQIKIRLGFSGYCNRNPASRHPAVDSGFRAAGSFGRHTLRGRRTECRRF